MTPLEKQKVLQLIINYYNKEKKSSIAGNDIAFLSIITHQAEMIRMAEVNPMFKNIVRELKNKQLTPEDSFSCSTAPINSNI